MTVCSARLSASNVCQASGRPGTDVLRPTFGGNERGAGCLPRANISNPKLNSSPVAATGIIAQLSTVIKVKTFENNDADAAASFQELFLAQQGKTSSMLTWYKIQ